MPLNIWRFLSLNFLKRFLDIVVSIGCTFSTRPRKKKFTLLSFRAKICYAGGRIVFIFLYFFVCCSPAAAYFRAIKQSINKTKLLFIDRLGERQ